MLYFLLNMEADGMDKGGWGGREREQGQTRGQMGRMGSDRGSDRGLTWPGMGLDGGMWSGTGDV